MSSIDEKFKKVIAEQAAPEEKIEEDALLAMQLLKKVQFQQKSDLKNVLGVAAYKKKR